MPAVRIPAADSVSWSAEEPMRAPKSKTPCRDGESPVKIVEKAGAVKLDAGPEGVVDGAPRRQLVQQGDTGRS